MSHTFPRADLGLERGVCAAVPLKFQKKCWGVGWGGVRILNFSR